LSLRSLYRFSLMRAAIIRRAFKRKRNESFWQRSQAIAKKTAREQNFLAVSIQIQVTKQKSSKNRSMRDYG
jgi:hypothetical protein